MEISLSPEQLVLFGGALVWIGLTVHRPTRRRRFYATFGSIEIVFVFIGLIMLLFGAAVLLRNPTLG